MPQSDGRNQLRRMALQVGDKMFKFAINPSDYQINFPQRSLATRTKSTVIIQDFGQDVGSITFSGTTGWRRGADGKTGKDRMDELEYYWDTYRRENQGNGNAPKKEMIFHNFTDNYSYVVHPMPEGLTIKRSAERSILYDYSIALYIVRNAEIPPNTDIHDPNIGSPKPSIPSDSYPSGNDVPGKGGYQPRNPLSAIPYNQSFVKQMLDKQGRGNPTAINPRYTQNSFVIGVEELRNQLGVK